MSDTPNLPKSVKTAHLLAKNPSPQISFHLYPKQSPCSPKPTFKTQALPLGRQHFPVHISPKHLSDKDLYSRCQLYGGNAKKWLQKFAGLLPEVYRRFLYKKHGCGSIHEFAQKLSGMHERTVKKILNLHERLEDKPHLLALFESGEQGWSKLEKVAFIATSETEADFAEKVKMLPKNALEIYVRNQREKLTPGSQSRLDNDSLNLQIAQVPQIENLPNIPPASCGTTNLSSLSESQTPPPLQTTVAASNQSTTATPSPYHETFTNFSFPISTRSRQKLNIVKLTLEKQHRQTLTWNEVIQLWPIHNQKIIVKKVCPSCALRLANPVPTCIQTQNQSSKSPPPADYPARSSTQPATPTKNHPPANQRTQSTSTNSSPQALPPGATEPTASRPIPAPIKNLILSMHGQICAFPGCNEAFTEFHHVDPFAIHKSHDPRKIYPICSTHHTLFHAGLVANQEKPPAFWYIRNQAKQNHIDKKVMEYKLKN